MCILALLTLAAAAPADHLRVADGLEVRLYAQSPQLYNPTNIDVDARGRVWVAEGVDYRTASKKHDASRGYRVHPQGDRIVILEDADGDGVAERSKVLCRIPSWPRRWGSPSWATG